MKPVGKFFLSLGGFLRYKIVLRAVVTALMASLMVAIPSSSQAALTSGAVFALDASTYSGSGNWVDSISSVQTTLTGSPTYSSTEGGHFVLNGTSQYMSIPDSANTRLSSATPRTYQIWIKPNSISTSCGVADATDATCTIFGKLTNGGNWDGFFLSLRENGSLILVTNGSGIGKTTFSTTNFLSNDNWYLITLISQITATADSTKVYVNSNLVISTAHGTDTISETNPLLVGFGHVPGQKYFKGAIGNIYIYSKALSASEIADNYSATSSGRVASLTARTLAIDTASYSSSYTMVQTPPTLTATQSAGTGAKTFTSSTTSVCTVNSSTGVVAFVGAGTCSITSSIAEDATYAAATSSAITITISRATQTVTWAPTTDVNLSQSPLTPSVLASALGSAGISYAVTNAGTTSCTVNSSTGVLTYTAIGSCQITATSAQTATYNTGTTAVTFVISTTPGAPTIGTATSTGVSTATVAFTAPASNGGATITSYTIISNPSISITTSGGTTSPLTATGTFVSGTAYTFTVTATNSAGTSSASSASNSITPNPAAALTPTFGSATATADGFTVSITNYSASYTWPSPSVSSGSVTAATASGSTQVLTVTGLAAGASATITQTTTRTGYTSGTATVTATSAVAPGAPTITAGSAGNGTASIAFTAGSTGGAPITNYEYSTNDGSTWTAKSPSTVETPITIAGLTNGTAYTIKIRAVNTAGSGTASSAVVVTPQAVGPGAPTILSAIPGNGSAQITVTADTGSGGSAITNYAYSTDDGANWTPLATPSTSTTILITSLTNTVPESVPSDFHNSWPLAEELAAAK